MPKKKETSSKQREQEGKRLVTFAEDVATEPYPPRPNDENDAIQHDISFEVEWNRLVEQHRAARHFIQNTENKMWEMQYSRREMLTEGPSTHRPQSPHPDKSTADAVESRMLKMRNEIKQWGILDKGQAKSKDIESEEEKRRREEMVGKNIWAAFDRHSLPRDR